MPQDRLLHPRAGHSRKVNALSDFEFRVWWTYQMAADDFGVMRRDPVVIQAANDSLARRSRAVVNRALDRLVEIGLVTPFEHQDSRYICQLDWQDFQKVRWPRESHQPVPTAAILQQCSGDTRELFRKHFRSTSEVLPEDSRHVHAREEANGLRLTADGKRQTARTGNGAMAGALPRDHLRHEVCGRVCLQQSQFQQFTAKFGGEQSAASTAVRDWAKGVLAAWNAPPLGTQPIAGTTFQFWDARWEEWQGRPQAAPRQRLTENPDTMVAGVREILRKQGAIP